MKRMPNNGEKDCQLNAMSRRTISRLKRRSTKKLTRTLRGELTEGTGAFYVASFEGKAKADREMNLAGSEWGYRPIAGASQATSVSR